MPKLPDKNDLGQPGSFRTGRTLADFPGVNTSAAEGAEIGQGVSRLGATVAKIGQAEFEAETARRNQTRKEDDSLDLIKADAYHEKHLSEAERGFDTDPDHANYDLKFQPLAATITTDAAGIIRNPKLREKWVLGKAAPRNESVRGRILDRGLGLQREAKEVEVDEALKTYGAAYGSAADDAARTRVLADMDATIGLAEQTGLVRPGRAQALREKHVDGAIVFDAEARAVDDPGSVLNELEDAKSPRFARLTPEHRRALVNNIKENYRPYAHQAVLDEIARLRETGEAPVDALGRSALDRAQRFLTRNQYAKMQLARDEAALEHEALSGLPDLTDDEAAAHIADLIPDETRDDVSYRSAVRVHDKAERAWRNIREVRRKDPAAAVLRSPEVQDVERLIATQEARDAAAVEEGGTVFQQNRLTPQRKTQMRLEARIEAQTRLGILNPKLVTRAEADKLLGIEDPAGMDEDTYREKLVAAANRAEEEYGPEYAREVFTSAYKLQKWNKTENEYAAGVAYDIATGQPVTASDLRRVGELDDIDRVGRTFELPQLDENRPAIAQAPAPLNLGGQARTPSAGRAVTVTWNEAQRDWLMQDPQTRTGTFDRTFGAGAAAEAIKRASGVKAKPASAKPAKKPKAD